MTGEAVGSDEDYLTVTCDDDEVNEAMSLALAIGIAAINRQKNRERNHSELDAMACLFGALCPDVEARMKLSRKAKMILGD